MFLFSLEKHKIIWKTVETGCVTARCCLYLYLNRLYQTKTICKYSYNRYIHIYVIYDIYIYIQMYIIYLYVVYILYICYIYVISIMYNVYRCYIYVIYIYYIHILWASWKESISIFSHFSWHFFNLACNFLIILTFTFAFCFLF